MDREKAFSYFKRTGHIYLIVYINYNAEPGDDFKKYMSLHILEFNDFQVAEKKYNRIIKDGKEYGMNKKPVFANKTTAKRCFYPYGDILD